MHIAVSPSRYGRGGASTHLRSVAQQVEHLVWDQGVAGSSPVIPTLARSVGCGLLLTWMLEAARFERQRNSGSTRERPVSCSALSLADLLARSVGRGLLLGKGN